MIGGDLSDLGAGARPRRCAAGQRLRRHAADGALSDVSTPPGGCSRARHQVARSLAGSYVTSLDMAGCSITVTLADDAMLALWDAPVHTAALRWKM